MPKLPNLKHEMFCQGVATHGNATKAAVDAGLSKKTAGQAGSRLLKNVKVQARISELQDKSLAKCEVTREEVIRELKGVAFVDISRAYNENGDLLPLEQIPEDIRRAIAGIEVWVEKVDVGETDEEGNRVKEIVGKTKKLRLSDKIRALELLGRHLKMFSTQIEHSGKVTLESISDEELDKRIKELLREERKK